MATIFAGDITGRRRAQQAEFIQNAANALLGAAQTSSQILFEADKQKRANEKQSFDQINAVAEQLGGLDKLPTDMLLELQGITGGNFVDASGNVLITPSSEQAFARRKARGLLEDLNDPNKRGVVLGTENRPDSKQKQAQDLEQINTAADRADTRAAKLTESRERIAKAGFALRAQIAKDANASRFAAARIANGTADTAGIYFVDQNGNVKTAGEIDAADIVENRVKPITIKERNEIEKGNKSVVEREAKEAKLAGTVAQFNATVAAGGIPILVGFAKDAAKGGKDIRKGPFVAQLNRVIDTVSKGPNKEGNFNFKREEDAALFAGIQQGLNDAAAMLPGQGDQLEDNAGISAEIMVQLLRDPRFRKEFLKDVEASQEEFIREEKLKIFEGAELEGQLRKLSPGSSLGRGTPTNTTSTTLPPTFQDQDTVVLPSGAKARVIR